MARFGTDLDAPAEEGMTVGRVDVASGRSPWRPFDLEDFDLNLLKRMAVDDIVSFSTVRMKATSQADYSWAQAAEEFKVRSFLRARRSRRSMRLLGLTSSFVLP